MNGDRRGPQVLADTVPAGLTWGYRIDRADGESRNGFRWPERGWAEAAGPFRDRNRGTCPSADGDGICIARTWAGVRSGGNWAEAIRIVGWADDDVLGQDPHKVRVRRAWVGAVVPVRAVVGPRAALRWAGLPGADLAGCDLRGANLRGADLRGADLHKADLRGADLRWAIFRRADLRSADLRGANLNGTDLSMANLSGARVRGADLRLTNLHGVVIADVTV